MENRLRSHIEILFRDMPQNAGTQEIKEEILQNLIEKYYDLLADGKDPETAYSIAVASIGDIHSLFPDNPENISKLVSKQRKKSALLISGAVMLYILSIIPPIIADSMGGGSFNETVGIGFMFLMIALATGMIIYNAMTKYKPTKNQTMVNEFKQWQSGKPSRKSIQQQVTGIIWTVTVIVYFLVSFLTMAWYITWIIFLIGAVVAQIVRLCMSLNNDKEKEKYENS
ncbi:MAG: permease prefix domain 1-containing protein [Acutalibacteraceae bacterium]|nr:permease prefix domain 1-containing protein [Acutalibacteraceae bacterium]